MSLDAWIDRLDGLMTASSRRRLNDWKNPSWWYLLIFWPWLLGAVYDIYLYRVDRAIAARERTAVGVITLHDRPNHNQYGYTFTIDGKSYSGLGNPQGAEPVIGQQVRVFYDPSDPRQNSLMDFDELSSSMLDPVPLISIGIGAGTAFIFFKRREHRRLIREKTP